MGRRSNPTTAWTSPTPSAGRTLRDMGAGYVIVGLDGGMPDRPNPCFAAQWAVRPASVRRGRVRQHGRRRPRRSGQGGAPQRARRPCGPLRLRAWPRDTGLAGRRTPRGVARIPGPASGRDHRPPERAGRRRLPRGHLLRARALEGDHRRCIDLESPPGSGSARRRGSARQQTCRAESFGDRRPDIVQRIGTGSDGRPLDRNLTCPGTDLTGLVRPPDSRGWPVGLQPALSRRRRNDHRCDPTGIACLGSRGAVPGPQVVVLGAMTEPSGHRRTSSSG